MPVACFAPPLTDELIAKYRAVADSIPDARGDVRDAMRQCLKAVELWWSLPNSAGSPRDKSLEVVHRGKDAVVKLTSFTEDLVAKMWDAVPWPHEIDGMRDLFLGVEADAVGRNTAAVAAWEAAVRAAVRAKHFPEHGRLEKTSALVRAVAGVRHLLTQDQEEAVQAYEEQIAEANAELAAAVSAGDYAGLPFPVMEPTPVRDAAFHLLWFVREFDRDREPLTRDKLPG